MKIAFQMQKNVLYSVTKDSKDLSRYGFPTKKGKKKTKTSFLQSWVDTWQLPKIMIKSKYGSESLLHFNKPVWWYLQMWQVLCDASYRE